MKHKFKFMGIEHSRYGFDALLFKCNKCDKNIKIAPEIWNKLITDGLVWTYYTEPCDETSVKFCKHCGAVIRFNDEFNRWYHPLQGIYLAPKHKIRCRLDAEPR